MRVSFDVRRSFNVVEIIESGAADVGFAIALEEELSQSLSMIPVATVEMVCLVQKDHPLAACCSITPIDIAPHPLIGLEMVARLSLLILNAFKASGVPYRTTVEVRYSETACLLVQAAVGITIVDWFSATAQTRQCGDLVAIPLSPTIRVEALAVFSRSRTVSRLSLSLVELTKASIRHFQTLSGQANSSNGPY